jgi:hypothetical protein
MSTSSLPKNWDSLLHNKYWVYENKYQSDSVELKNNNVCIVYLFSSFKTDIVHCQQTIQMTMTSKA